MFEIYKDKSGKFRFRLKAKNGEIICSSQGYTSKSSCKKGAFSLILNAKKIKFPKIGGIDDVDGEASKKNSKQMDIDKENDYVNMDLSHFTDTFVKVFVTNKTNEEMFNNLIDRLHNTIDTHEVNIIEDLNTDITSSVKENILEQGEDTLTFLGNYADQIDTNLDKHKLKNTLKDLYTDASER